MELVLKKEQLPTTIPGLHSFRLIGKEVLKAHQAKIRAMDSIDAVPAIKKAALNDAQDTAEILIDIGAKLGELLLDIPKGTKWDYQNNSEINLIKSTKTNELEKLGISVHEASRVQRIASNPDIVKESKERARKNNQIVTEGRA